MYRTCSGRVPAGDVGQDQRNAQQCERMQRTRCRKMLHYYARLGCEIALQRHAICTAGGFTSLDDLSEVTELVQLNQRLCRMK